MGGEDFLSRRGWKGVVPPEKVAELNDQAIRSNAEDLANEIMQKNAERLALGHERAEKVLADTTLVAGQLTELSRREAARSYKHNKLPIAEALLSATKEDVNKEAVYYRALALALTGKVDAVGENNDTIA